MAKNIQDKKRAEFNLIDLLMFMLARWYWFVLSLAVFSGLAWVVYASRPFVFFSSATVIIKDPSNKTSTAGLDRYDNFINKVNVANEILQFRSKKLFREVVQRVHADVSYKIDDGLRQRELYTQSPVTVSFIDMLPGRSVSLAIIPVGKDSVQVQIPVSKRKSSTFGVAVNDTVRLNDGLSMVVATTNYYNNSWNGKTIDVRKTPVDVMVGYYRNNFGIRQEGEESSILKLSLKDESPVRARDVLNTLITVYNQDAINDKNQVAINTANFINERLIIIESDLGSVENDLESFKKVNQVVDLSSSAGMYMQESQKYSSDVLELETQLQLADHIKGYLTDPTKEIDLIPANTGISDMNIESQINQYNTIKLRRDKLVDDSSEMNPVVLELNNSLRAMKQTIIRAVDNMIVSLNVRLKDARNREYMAQERMTSIPTQQRQMLSIERQQKIKESLYMFLLNRREENALSQAMADNNARVIDEASESSSPIAPSRNRIMLLGILVGLAVPGVVFLMMLFLDTKVRGRKDIEDAVDIPFLGEIPFDRSAKGKPEHIAVSVGEQSRDMLSEAFRILRTNMTFMMKHDRSPKVIAVTSVNEGAGKTFTSMNLAASFAFAKKKVVIVDLDIRKGTLSRMFHGSSKKAGVTDYIANGELTADDILIKGSNQSEMDIIPAGCMAPNPTELLMDGRLDELFSELRKRYDYIIADSVPVGMVADAVVSNRIADLTIFVIRSGKLDRRILPDIEKIYKEKKLVNMALLLNGTDCSHKGYGYGYGKDKDENREKRVMKYLLK